MRLVGTYDLDAYNAALVFTIEVPEDNPYRFPDLHQIIRKADAEDPWLKRLHFGDLPDNGIRHMTAPQLGGGLGTRKMSVRVSSWSCIELSEVSAYQKYGSGMAERISRQLPDFCFVEVRIELIGTVFDGYSAGQHAHQVVDTNDI